MLESGEWQALLEGAIRFERVEALWIGAAVLIPLVLLALIGGPLRLSVPRTHGRRRWIPLLPDVPWLASVAFRTGVLAMLATTLALPVALIPENTAGGEGIDLVIALDSSGSMKALDAMLEGQRATRLELAKRVVADFVRQREGDRIGLVVFGEHAFTQSPLTVDRRMLLRALERVDVGIAGDSTALGEAIGLSTRRLRVPGAPEAGRRLLLLLTDGRHNAGKLAPETAATIARMQGVRIHAVGIGTRGRVPFAQDSPGEPLRFEKVDLDRKTLRQVAEITGGKFFHAEHPQDLREITAAIDRLEKREHAGEPRYRRASLAPLALAAALALMLVEAALSHGLLRRLP